MTNVSKWLWLPIADLRLKLVQRLAALVLHSSTEPDELLQCDCRDDSTIDIAICIIIAAAAIIISWWRFGSVGNVVTGPVSTWMRDRLHLGM